MSGRAPHAVTLPPGIALVDLAEQLQAAGETAGGDGRPVAVTMTPSTAKVLAHLARTGSYPGL